MHPSPPKLHSTVSQVLHLCYAYSGTLYCLCNLQGQSDSVALLSSFASGVPLFVKLMIPFREEFGSAPVKIFLK